MPPWKALGATLVLLAVSGSEAAADWAKGMHSKARLVSVGEWARTPDAGTSPQGITHHAQVPAIVEGARTRWAVLDVRLDPKWKTYWRNPGDAGIPPHFDWAGSVNVKSVRLSWPAPKVFFDGYAWSNGYGDAVAIPISVEPENPENPVFLSLRFGYAVCLEICIPEEADFTLSIAPDEAVEQRQLEALFVNIPKVLPARSPSLVLSASLAQDDDKWQAVVELDKPADAKVELFVETTEGHGMPVPKALNAGSNGKKRFGVFLDGNSETPSGSIGALKLTVVWDGGAIEQAWALDGASIKH